MSTNTPRPAVDSLLGAPLDPQTYRNLGYLLLAFPLGLGYFVVLSVGVSLTLGLSVTLLGPVALLATVVLTLALAWLDARFTDRLLGVDLVGPAFPAGTDGIVDYLVTLLTARDPWLSGVYLCWRFLHGTLAFVVLASGVSLAVGLLAAPFVYGEFLSVNYQLGVWTVDTFAESLATAGVGLLVAYLTLVATNLVAAAGRLVADLLFGAPEAGPDPAPTIES